MTHALSKSPPRTRRFDVSEGEFTHLLRVFVLLLILGASRLLVCQNFPPSSVDPVRATEIQQRALLGSIKSRGRDARAQQEDQQRQFSAMFNQLVEAMNNFANRYNEGKGTVWPKREADRFGKAMRQIQQFEKSLRDQPTPLPIVERQGVN
jgi:hypothetical protein